MEDHGPIHRWLTSVEGEPQDHHDGGTSLQQESCPGEQSPTDNDSGEKQDQSTNAALVANIPCMQLEISDDLKGLAHSSFRKRNADQLDETNAPPLEEAVPRIKTPKRLQQSYELKSRHKTREDRYEYKGPSSVVVSQPQVSKPKTKRSRSRRHTLNDDFHAINVTDNRLTVSEFPSPLLPSCAHLKIVAQQHEFRYFQQGQEFFNKLHPK